MAATSRFCGQRVVQVWQEAHSQIDFELQNGTVVQLDRPHYLVGHGVHVLDHRTTAAAAAALITEKHVLAGRALDGPGKFRSRTPTWLLRWGILQPVLLERIGRVLYHGFSP